MKRRLWLLPPLLAVAGYFSADAVMAARQSGDGKVAAKVHTRTERPKFTVEQAMEAYDAERFSGGEPREPSTAELKQHILDLKKELASFPEEGDDSSEAKGYHHMLLEMAAFKLGTADQAAACEWMAENAPELRLITFDAWAYEDPAAAWQSIIQGQRQPPCDINTLMRLLKERAKTEPATLKQACLDVPWHLVRYVEGHKLRHRADGNFTQFEANISYGDHAEVWAQTGAARALAERGVPILGFFSAWADIAPAEAVKAWAEWPAVEGLEGEFIDILSSNAAEDSPFDEVIGAISEMTPEQRAKATAAVEKYLERGDRYNADFRRYREVLNIAPVEERGEE